eukprot:364821-Chlamydomonas_euryale.AAC.8
MADQVGRPSRTANKADRVGRPSRTTNKADQADQVGGDTEALAGINNWLLRLEAGRLPMCGRGGGWLQAGCRAWKQVATKDAAAAAARTQHSGYATAPA